VSDSIKSALAALCAARGITMPTPEPEPPPPPPPELYQPTKDIACWKCDFRDLPVEAGSVRAIITDLPYEGTWHHNLPDFAEWACRVLQPGGILATFYGQAWLPRLLAELDKRLYWQWLFIEPWCGGYPLMGRWVNSRYAPVVVYCNEPTMHLRRNVDDVLPASRKERDCHEHQKSLASVQHLVQAFSGEEGDLVADCCSGGWTTALACHETRRRFVGSDNRPDCLDVARKRFANLEGGTL
jgi:SAM-dependent methyltransferase